MAFAPALRAAGRVLRGRPDGVLPAFLLTPAISAVVRVVTLAGIATAYAHLEFTGRLRSVRADLAARDLDPPDPNTEPEAFADWMEGIVPVLETLVTPTTVGILAVTAAASLLLFVVLSSVATAAQLAACRGTLDDDRGTTAALHGARRHWRPILGLLLLEVALWVLVTGLAVGGVALGVAVSPLLGLLVGLVAAVVWIVAAIAIGFLFAFAPVAAVVDDVGASDALRGAAGYVRADPVDAVVYGVLAVGVIGTLYALAAVAGEAAGLLVGVGSFLFVGPVLSLTKTALYVRHVDSIAPPAAPDRPLRRQVVDGLGRGLEELVRFVRRSPAAVAGSALLFVAGIGLGWGLAAPYEGVVTTSIDGRLEGHFPPTAAAFFAANNWTVAVASGFGGLALAVPAAVSMLFNGTVLGVYGRLEVAPAELLAFVAPHGLLELPAIVVSGALGLSLGASAWRTGRGRASMRELADAVDRGFWVLVGVGVLLVLAGLIEGFVSPYYYRPFVGG